MKFSKLMSFFKKGSSTTESNTQNTRSMPSVSEKPDEPAQTTTSSESSSTQLNITSYRMHVLETENQYLYEQNRKLNRELKNARCTNDALKEIIKMKDSQIQSIVEDEYETLQKAHIIEESMRLLLLDGEKQAIASKDSKATFKHGDLESLKHFVLALKSIPSPQPQAKVDHLNISMPKSSPTHKHKYTKPLLPPLPAISDSEESFRFNIQQEIPQTRSTDPYMNLVAVPKNCSRSESVNFGKQLRLMASDF